MFHRSESRPQSTRRDSNSSTSSHNSHFVDRHQLSEFLTSFLTHMFAPTSCQQCTATSPYNLNSTNTADRKCNCIVDDEYVLFDDEQDGGPLCRETTIASWKMTAQRKRRFSMHRFGES